VGVAEGELVGKLQGLLLHVQEVAQGGEVFQNPVGARGEGNSVDGKTLLLEPQGLLPLDPRGEDDQVGL
jgi:hypothetical protein